MANRAQGAKTPLMLLGMGFAMDAFDLFILSDVLVLLGLNGDTKPTDFDKSWLTGTALVGAIFGQIIFGFSGDVKGHAKPFIATLVLMTLGSLISALMPTGNHRGLFAGLAISRFVLGVGIGGEYPLSVVLGASMIPPPGRSKAEQLTRIFAFQGLGIAGAVVMGYVVFQIMSAESAWRFCLGIGALFCVILAGFRYWYLFVLPARQTTDYNQLVDNGEKLDEKKDQSVSVPPSQPSAPPSQPINGSKPSPTVSEVWGIISNDSILRWRLFGTAFNWFLLDIVFYANGLFSGTLLNHFTNKDTEKTLRYNIWLGLLGLFGYVVAIWLVRKKISRRIHQTTGFALLGVMYFICAGMVNAMQEYLSVLLLAYGLTFLLSNAGPNTTTYVLSGESFPAHIRTSCSGMSAAAGKAGAAVGAYAMAPLASYSLETVFCVCGAISILGALTSYVFTAKQEELDELNKSASNDSENPAQ
jgi:PHS family inorganic phosphate transporter-like MFS transporter